MSDQNNEQTRDEQRLRSFNPNEHLMQIKSRDGMKDYLPVQWRLVWFRQECPQGTIDTEEVEYDTEKEYSIEAFVWNNEKKRSEKVVKTARGYARYRAVITDGKGGRATGTKSECRANFEDYGEKAETGAIGRALAALGYGTQFTGDEWNEAHRIVDAPVDRAAAPMPVPVPVSSNGNAHGNAHSNSNGAARKPLLPLRPEADAESETVATEQQVASIRKLCERLGKAEPEHIDTMSYADARELIARLSYEYKQARSKAS